MPSRSRRTHTCSNLRPHVRLEEVAHITGSCGPGDDPSHKRSTIGRPGWRMGKIQKAPRGSVAAPLWPTRPNFTSERAPGGGQGWRWLAGRTATAGHPATHLGPPDAGSTATARRRLRQRPAPSTSGWWVLATFELTNRSGGPGLVATQLVPAKAVKPGQGTADVAD